MLGVTLSVKGIEQLTSVLTNLSEEDIKEKALDILVDELVKVADQLQTDTNIPEEVRKAMIVYYGKLSGLAVLTVFVQGRLQWLRFGKVLKWRRYKCTVRKYYGGVLSPEYELPEYVKEKFEEAKPRIIDRVTRGIIDYIRSVVIT